MAPLKKLANFKYHLFYIGFIIIVMYLAFGSQ
jgi:hypothetical protein